MEHHLKIFPEFFEAAKEGAKPFELRKDDRSFSVGDVLVLEEWLCDQEREQPEAYTGRSIRREITYILRNAPQYGLAPGYCILGTK